ncbi:GNAT family N-acetyltransferase [Hyphomonas sp.]|uniref:GNAT family N-acetyltransferase n=1 Tax=Hyphomonas sp. TaxID=87 RepID=UPI0032ECA588
MSDEMRTQRLLLRPVGPVDAGPITQVVQNPGVYRMLASVAPGQCKAQTLGWIAGHGAAATSDREHVRAMILDGELVGVIGANRKVAGLPFTIGYWLSPSAWGKGLTTEAAAALLSWLERRGETAFLSGHFADNPASGRVLQKLGFMRAGRSKLFSLGRGEAVDHFDMARIARNA